ncbi:MAG: PDZ domain-containing protein [Dehalococcoidales bacterium]|nr:PDZ domain-containing protein [Dehalococcoidales bacterium]
MVKQFLSQKGVRYEEKDVSRSREYAEELVKNTGQMGVPVTVIDGDVIVGFNRPELERAVANMKPVREQPQQPPRPLGFGASIADAAIILSKQGKQPFNGAYVGKIKNKSLSDEMGLIPGDVITRANGTGITGAGDLERLLKSLRKGDKLTVGFLRGTRAMNADGIF